MTSEEVHDIIEGMKYKKEFNLNEVEKDLIDNHDTDLNTCNKCDVVVDSATELYWQGSCADSYHECMEGYDALCDDCFGEVSDDNINT